MTEVDGELEQEVRRLTDLRRLAMTRKWLKKVALQSEIAYGLFPQSSLTLVKFMVSLKLLLGSK